MEYVEQDDSSLDRGSLFMSAASDEFEFNDTDDDDENHNKKLREIEECLVDDSHDAECEDKKYDNTSPGDVNTNNDIIDDIVDDDVYDIEFEARLDASSLLDAPEEVQSYLLKHLMYINQNNKS